MVEPLILTPDTALVELPNLVRRSAELSQAYSDRERIVTDGALQAMGTLLWQALHVGEKFQTAKKQAGQAILPLVVASDNPEILQLPWETLYHPYYGFLALHGEFTLTRTSPVITVTLPEIETGPLRILLFTALPDDLSKDDQLMIEEEQAAVLEALGPWLQSGHVELQMPDDGLFSEFRKLLTSFRPHLVWLSGHGVFRSDTLNHKQKGYFLFESEKGGRDLIDEDTLAGAFSGTAVQALILSACQTGKAVSADLNNGLMYALAQKGIPHVIGMRESIFDRAGVQFAHTFFSGLLQKRQIALALQQARQAITKPLRDDEDAKRYRYADLSFGQWCLPMLLSREHGLPIIDWHFTPQPMRRDNIWNETLDNISLPSCFIGRRRELRRWQRDFRDGKTKVLLVTGAGGVGKTAFAGKLANTHKADGYEIFAFSARPEHDWRDTLRQMEESLDKDQTGKYNNIQQKYSDPAKRAPGLLKLLVEQFQGKVLLLFDNLESVQDGTTLQLTDSELQQWIDAAMRLQKHGMRVLLTSRCVLPGWTEPLQPLCKPVYRDFLAVAQQQNLPTSFLRDYERLWRAYEVLGGNYRALEFFAAALQDMDAGEEEVFLQQLQKAEAEIQIDMALEKVWSHRTTEERELLRRMTANTVPVPPEGIMAIAPSDMQQPADALEVLLSVSLVERYHNAWWKTDEYLVSPIVQSWLEKQGVAKLSKELLQKAATYHEWLLKHERQTLDQAIITHTALIRAEMDEEAHRITLEWIVGPMDMAGMCQSLLQTFLLPACHSADEQTLARALGETGTQYLNVGKYDTALEYLNRSMAIYQEIGDKTSEGRVLNNIAGIFRVRGDYDTALEYLNRSLSITKEIGDKSGEGTTLNNISQIYDARGEYDTALVYLKQSMTICQEIGDKSGEGTTLNNISQIYHARGEYDTALVYLKQSMTICQKIGDSAGFCFTLFNMGHIHAQNNDISNAVSLWVKAYKIARQINLANVLQALAALAPQLGLPEGLEGWDTLSKQMDEQQEQS